MGGHEKTRTAHSLRTLTAEAWVAIIGLALIAVLQNVDVILAQHRLPDKAAGAYAAAAVAAKVVVWVAIGIGFYLLPEAARRHAVGQDARPVLFKALAMTGAVAAPCIIVYAVFPKLLLRLAFGEEYANLGASALLELGVAMSFLALCYLAVQLLLALRQVRFLWILGAVAVAEVLALLFLPGGDSITGFATIVLVVQVVAALGAGLAAYFASAAPANGGFAEPEGSSTAQTPNRATSL
jgi:O-antigen/teichoic acid export membrane protein